MQGQAVGDHAVETEFAPVVLEEADAVFKVLLGVKAIADEGDLLEGDLADDELVGIAGESQGQHLAAAAGQVRHLQDCRSRARGIVHDVEAAASGDLTHEIHGVGLRGVDGLDAHGLHKLPARLVDLGNDDAPGAEGLGKDRDIEADGRAAGDKDRISRLNLAALHDMVADSKGLAEDGDLIGDIVIERAELVHTHLGILRKAAVDMDAQELEVFAHMAEAAAARRAVTAGDDRVHQHPLAHFEGAVVPLGQGGDVAEDLMAQHRRHRRRHVLAAVDGHVRAADPPVADLDEGLFVIRHRHGDIGQLKIKPVFQNCCFHTIILSV